MATTITDQLAGYSETVAVKAPCRAATTTNITLSGEQTVDGVALVANDRVLVKDQTDTTQNGIYNVKPGSWTRATDFNDSRDIVDGTLVIVTNANPVEFYQVVPDSKPTIPGTTGIAFISAGLHEASQAAAAQAQAAAGLAVTSTVNFPTSADLLADNVLIGYSGKQIDVVAGQIIKAEDYQYKVAAEAATDHHRITAGGVKLYVLPSAGGVYHFEAFGASSTSDSAAAMLAAFNAAGGKPITSGGKTIRLDTVAEFSGATVLENLKIDCTNGGSLFLNGGMTNLPNLDVDLARGQRTAAFSSAHGLSAGDVFCVYNPTASSFYAGSSSAHDGDWFEVVSVIDGTRVQLDHAAIDTYTASGHTCHSMDGEGVQVDKLEVTGAPNGVNSIQIYRHRNVYITNFKFNPATAPGTPNVGRGLWINQCHNYMITAAYSRVTEGSNSYPISNSNSRNGTVIGFRGVSDWHGIATGGSTGPGCVPNRNLKFSECNLTGVGDVGAADIHAQTEYSEYLHCSLNQGAHIDGRNNSVTSCFIQARTNSNPWGVLFKPAGGIMKLKNSTIEIPVDTSSSWGAVHVSTLDDLGSDLTIEIDELDVVSHSTLNNLRLIYAAPGTVSHSHRIDFRIGKLRFHGETAPFSVFAVSGSGDLSGQMSLEIDDFEWVNNANTSGYSGVRYVVASSNENYDMPMRLPTQTAVSDIATTTSIKQVDGGFVDYKYLYPRIPSCIPSVQRTDGAPFTVSTSSSGQVIPHAFDVESGRARLWALSSGGVNFGSANGNLRLTATVGIRDF